MGNPVLQPYLNNFIDLIPKKDQPDRLRDLSPISPCNISYNIFSKIITLRLSTILPFIISPQHGCFVKGRLIIENVGLVEEMVKCIDSKAYEGNMVPILDMEKAFDRIKWPFLFEIPKRFGFSKCSISHISSYYISSSSRFFSKG